ncbi:putative S-adenosylmethionine-dependent methyltransferase At5g38100 [Morella rubra]|uniref:Putative S-adenosylmethionine-dependent methyltransferase At5g38100 n=1 Tax=Morella rubra TaxID=262757 RepID=A0A6A1V153_9ROSI|nr:putative S-adenosylmethionine-dependent methyltransferase At5g38100 [Morella rubra]
MPAEGKRLRCDSSVRAESSPGTLAVSGPSLRDRNELPSPATASPVGTQSSCASLLGVQFQRRGVRAPYPDMNKEEWTRVCDLFASEEFQRRSAINKENRAKLKIVHTSGARSFQRARALLRSDMEQTMREHTDDGGAATEAADADDELMQMMQRKKDEEHRKMMEEQQRTLVEQQERRMQLMAEQMREQLVEQIRQLQSQSENQKASSFVLGLISEAEVDSFNLPIYATWAREMTELVAKDGHFSNERMGMTTHQSIMDGRPMSGQLSMMQLRASLSDIISKYFGAEIIDELFHRFYKKNPRVFRSAGVHV